MFLKTILLLAMLFCHIVDDCKANKKNINLIQDQLIHIFQIVMTWIMFIAVR